MSTMTLNQQTDTLDGLKILSEIFEVPVEVKEFQNDWILFTYDIPNTKEGIKTRYEFLHKARWLGAIQHTESVYLMPWTHRSNTVALNLASVGKIYLWYTKVGDKQQAINLSKDYDTGLEARVEDLSKRVDKILEQAKKDHRGQVLRMAETTWEKINGIGKAILERCDENLANKLYSVIGTLKYAESLVKI